MRNAIQGINFHTNMATGLGVRNVKMRKDAKMLILYSLLRYTVRHFINLTYVTVIYSTKKKQQK